MDEILHVKLGISTKLLPLGHYPKSYFQLYLLIYMYQYATHWGLHLPVIIYFAALCRTDLSTELALRSQYQCCFHKLAKSANYSITLYIKSF